MGGWQELSSLNLKGLTSAQSGLTKYIPNEAFTAMFISILTIVSLSAPCVGLLLVAALCHRNGVSVLYDVHSFVIGME